MKIEKKIYLMILTVVIIILTTGCDELIDISSSDATLNQSEDIGNNNIIDSDSAHNSNGNIIGDNEVIGENNIVGDNKIVGDNDVITGNNRVIIGNGSRDNCVARSEVEIASEEWSFGFFNGINIDGVFHVMYRQSDVYRIELEMQESLFEITEVGVANGILQVNQNQSGLNFQSDDEVPRLYIYAPYLTEITFDGVITARNWDVNNVESFILHVDGVTTFQMSGRAEMAEFNVEGVAAVDVRDFQTLSSVINIDGVSSLSVSVENDLDVSISGLATVEYFGNPVVTERNVDRHATLRQMN